MKTTVKTCSLARLVVVAVSFIFFIFLVAIANISLIDTSVNIASSFPSVDLFFFCKTRHYPRFVTSARLLECNFQIKFACRELILARNNVVRHEFVSNQLDVVLLSVDDCYEENRKFRCSNSAIIFSCTFGGRSSAVSSRIVQVQVI